MWEEIRKKIFYRLQFINNARSVASSLSNLINNLAEGIYQSKCKYGHDNKWSETCGLKCKGCKCCLKYTSVIDDLIEYKCLCCNKN